MTSTDLIPSPASGFVSEAADRRLACCRRFSRRRPKWRGAWEFFTAQINNDHTRAASR
jgi:hypothetical protein